MELKSVSHSDCFKPLHLHSRRQRYDGLCIRSTAGPHPSESEAYIQSRRYARRALYGGDIYESVTKCKSRKPWINGSKRSIVCLITRSELSKDTHTGNLASETYTPTSTTVGCRASIRRCRSYFLCSTVRRLVWPFLGVQIGWCELWATQWEWWLAG